MKKDSQSSLKGNNLNQDLSWKIKSALQSPLFPARCYVSLFVSVELGNFLAWPFV